MASSRPLALTALLLTMLIWGSTFVVTKAAASEIGVLQLSFLRFFIAALVLVPMTLARGGLRRTARMTWSVLLAMALTGMVVFVLGFNYGLVYASATQGSLIYALCPAAIALAAVIVLRERLSPLRLTGIVLSLLGVVLVILASEAGQSSPRPVLGAACMFGAVVMWALYTILAKRLEGEDPLLVITWVTLVAVALLLPLAAFEYIATPPPMPSLQAIGGVVFLGVAGSALAYVLYGYALRHLDATLVGVFTNLDPLIGVITAVLWLHERLHAGHLFGGALVLIGIALASSTQRVSETPSNV